MIKCGAKWLMITSLAAGFAAAAQADDSDIVSQNFSLRARVVMVRMQRAKDRPATSLRYRRPI